MCKHSNVFSRPVLIARGLDFELHLPLCSFQVRVRVPARRFGALCEARRFSAAIAEGSHLFPFRTEKLSPPAPMVLRGKPRGRVGRRRIFSRGPVDLHGRPGLSAFLASVSGGGQGAASGVLETAWAQHGASIGPGDGIRLPVSHWVRSPAPGSPAVVVFRRPVAVAVAVAPTLRACLPRRSAPAGPAARRCAVADCEEGVHCGAPQTELSVRGRQALHPRADGLRPRGGRRGVQHAGRHRPGRRGRRRRRPRALAGEAALGAHRALPGHLPSPGPPCRPRAPPAMSSWATDR